MIFEVIKYKNKKIIFFKRVKVTWLINYSKRVEYQAQIETSTKDILQLIGMVKLIRKIKIILNLIHYYYLILEVQKYYE